MLCAKKRTLLPSLFINQWGFSGDSVGIWHMYCLARPSFLNITDRLRFFNQTTISRSSSDLIPNKWSSIAENPFFGFPSSWSSCWRLPFRSDFCEWPRFDVPLRPNELQVAVNSCNAEALYLSAKKKKLRINCSFFWPWDLQMAHVQKWPSSFGASNLHPHLLPAALKSVRPEKDALWIDKYPMGTICCNNIYKIWQFLAKSGDFDNPQLGGFEKPLLDSVFSESQVNVR